MAYFEPMENVVTMDKFGRLILPGAIRKALRIRAPAAFKVEVVGNTIELTALPSQSGAVIKKRKGLLVLSTGSEKFDASEAVRALRDERV